MFRNVLKLEGAHVVDSRLATVIQYFAYRLKLGKFIISQYITFEEQQEPEDERGGIRTHPRPISRPSSL